MKITFRRAGVFGDAVSWARTATCDVRLRAEITVDEWKTRFARVCWRISDLMFGVGVCMGCRRRVDDVAVPATAKRAWRCFVYYRWKSGHGKLPAAQ